jgi:hypothetical protein
MTTEMELVVGADGVARCIYDEALDLRELGKLQITRASHVEPDVEGYWFADMGPVDGPVLGPFRSRTEALGAERGWLVGEMLWQHNAIHRHADLAASLRNIVLQGREAHRSRRVWSA